MPYHTLPLPPASRETEIKFHFLYKLLYWIQKFVSITLQYLYLFVIFMQKLAKFYSGFTVSPEQRKAAAPPYFPPIRRRMSASACRSSNSSSAADIRTAPWPRIIICSSPSEVATRTRCSRRSFARA